MDDKQILKDIFIKLGLDQYLWPKSILKKITLDVSKARKNNIEEKKSGYVKLGKIWRAQKTEHIPFDPKAISIYISKGKGYIGNALSPFNTIVDSSVIENWTDTGNKNGNSLSNYNPNGFPLELVWQAAKVKKDEIENGKANDKYFKRRNSIYMKGIPKRRYFPSAETYGAVFGNKDFIPLKWIESRYFYCEQYENAIVSKPEFLLLKELVNNGFNLLLLGPDGYDINYTKEDIEKAYYSTDKPFGHERVLMALLLDVKPWKSSSKKSSSKKSSSKKSSSKKSSSKKSSAKKSSSKKSSAKKSKTYKPCKPHQVRDPNTNRCINKTTYEKKYGSKKTSSKKPSSKKPSSKKSKTYKPCKPHQVRDPFSNRCINKTTYEKRYGSQK